VDEVLKGRRDVALITWGVSAFISDEDIKHIAEFLHSWAGKKSVWAFNAQAARAKNVVDPSGDKVLAYYKQIGAPMTIRSIEEYVQLVKPWHPDPGFIPFNEWHKFDQAFMSEADLVQFGASGSGYGAYLHK